MSNDYLEEMVSAIRALDVSEHFVQGSLFLLGGALMGAADGIPPEAVYASLQRVYPHDIRAIHPEILERINDRIIGEVIEEFLFHLGVDIPFREIKVGSYSNTLVTPRDNGLFPDIDFSSGEMWAVSRLYFLMAEELGRRLEKSNYSSSEAYLAGICVFSMWSQIDFKAMGWIIRTVNECAPPVFKFIFSIPRIPEAQCSGWLPTQMALWGFITGLDNRFIQVAWPYQSWLLFHNKQPILGIEELSPPQFYEKCLRPTQEFYSGNVQVIRQVSGLEIGPREVPAWSPSDLTRQGIFREIKRMWGYDPEDENLIPVERKQVNACIIFVLFCSLCRAAAMN